jgi:hypothetical protein
MSHLDSEAAAALALVRDPDLLNEIELLRKAEGC